MPPYSSWAQVAGYFDGDGTIYFSDTTNQPYKLTLSIVSVDQSHDQLIAVQAFLRNQGLRTGNILKTSKGTAFQLAISEVTSVTRALKEMLPYLCKKENEAKGVLDYYAGKMTGNELEAIFKAEVAAGRRERRDRKVVINTPYLRPVGDAVMKAVRNDKLRDAFGRYRAKVTPDDYHAMRRAHFEEGMRLRDLVKLYPQYARETIRRVLGEGRGYVGVAGVGRVETTDNR